MMKNKSFVPSFLSAFARISEPVISAIVVSRDLDDLVVAQRSYLRLSHAEPVLERFCTMLAKERRRLHRRRTAVEAHGPAGHLELTVCRVFDFLDDGPLFEIGIVQELLRIAHRTCGNGGADHAHALVLVALAREFADDPVDFLRVFDSRFARFEARIADQVLAPDRFEKPRPVLWIAPA